MPQDSVAHSKPWITEADRHALNAVLAAGMLAQGRLVAEFEAQVARYLGALGGVAVASGTAALVLALKVIGVKTGEEVILPTYVCASVFEAVVSVGAIPILCDSGTEWNMTPETVAARITPRTAAIIVVHIFGIMADTDSFKQFGLPIIEDCCHAFGGQHGGRFAGMTGAVGVYSFHATKCLATGEGGIAVSNDSELLGRMRLLRDGDDANGRERIASPMSDLQAALGLSQLSRYGEFLARRSTIAGLYFAELGRYPVRAPETLRGRSMFFRFPVRVTGEFEAQQRQFDALGVQVRRGVDSLLHRKFDVAGDNFPVAERLFAETVSLPIYPALREHELQAVLAACSKVWGQ